MEDEFIVRTHSEGTLKVPASVDRAVSKSGGVLFNNRALGKVTVIVEKEAGVITKEKIKWGEFNSDGFQDSIKAEAQAILDELKIAAGNGGSDEDVRLKIVAKK